MAARQFAGGGAMGAMMLAHDWRASPLGPIEHWPVELRNAVALMLPASAEIVLFWGADYAALYNDAYAPTIGNKHPAALGCPAREAWSELWDDLEPLLTHVRTTGETYSAKDRPFYIERAGFGEEVYFDISYSPVPLGDGSVGGVLCIVSETTARVRAARAIAADNARLAQMFDDAPGFIAVLRGPNHIYELANPAYHQLIGEWHSDIIGQSLRDVLPEVENQGYLALLDEVFNSGRPYRADGATVRLQRGPGNETDTRYVDFVFQPITDSQGAVTGVFIQGTDVTDRRVAEEALTLSRESLELATDAAEIGTWDLDVVDDRLNWSERTKAVFGISPDVAISMDDFYAGLHPDDLAATTAAFEAALDPMRRELYDVEYRTIGAEDGIIRWVAAKGRGIFDRDRCVRAVGTVIDITRQRAQREELRESEARFRLLADSLPALVWVSDEVGNLVFANRHFEEMFGISVAELLRDGWPRLFPPEDQAAMIAFRERRRSRPNRFSGDVRLMDAAGQMRWVHAESRPRVLGDAFKGFVGCAVDVSEAHLAGEALERRIAERTTELTRQIAERERVEETLHQMQRLEAVGQLTSGVAHDFNNLLTVVLGNVSMIERVMARDNADARILQRLANVRAAAERGAALTSQLLAFSRRQRLEAKVVDLNDTVSGMRELMQSSLGGGIAIETALAPDIWPALVDATQIELAILNLAINARDAIGVGDGTLTLETANVHLGEPDRPEEPPAGDYVAVTVADNGSGMTSDVRARVFEPFFTTKEVGKGSGLGLAQVYGFVSQSSGGIRIDSVPGEGTRVTLYLPRATGAAEQRAGDRDRTGASSIVGRTILVLDDDDAVREVTAGELRDAGAQVIEATNGAGALAALADRSGIDAVVADFAMPGMNGAEFAERAQARWPGLPVLFVTGYADLSQIAHVSQELIVQKPFAAGIVVQRVGKMIEDRAAA